MSESKQPVSKKQCHVYIRCATESQNDCLQCCKNGREDWQEAVLPVLHLIAMLMTHLQLNLVNSGSSESIKLTFDLQIHTLCNTLKRNAEGIEIGKTHNNKIYFPDTTFTLTTYISLFSPTKYTLIIYIAIYTTGSNIAAHKTLI